MTLRNKIWHKTLNHLLTGSLFNKLSVQEICDLCQIHRSSFYRAFDDKFALIEYGINQLWNEYYGDMSFSILKKPFTSADDFFANSKAESLLQSQYADIHLLQDIKEITLELLRLAYQHVLVDDSDSLISGYICSSIDYFDTWNHQQRRTLSPTQLDVLFQAMIFDPLANNFLE